MDNLQPQSIPVEIQPDSPFAMAQLIEVARQLAQSVNSIKSRLDDIEKIVLN